MLRLLSYSVGLSDSSNYAFVKSFPYNNPTRQCSTSFKSGYIYNVYIVFSVGRHQSLLEAPGATSIQTGSPVLQACTRGGNGVQNWQVPVWWINCSFSFHHGWSMQLLSHLEFGRFPTKGLACPYVLQRPRVRSRTVLCAKQGCERQP